MFLSLLVPRLKSLLLWVGHIITFVYDERTSWNLLALWQRKIRETTTDDSTTHIILPCTPWWSCHLWQSSAVFHVLFFLVTVQALKHCYILHHIKKISCFRHILVCLFFTLAVYDTTISLMLSTSFSFSADVFSNLWKLLQNTQILLKCKKFADCLN